MTGSLTLFESVFLGIVQGLTEFLPVSSSGHLVLARHLFDMPQVPLLFDVTLHVATLIVVLFFYRLYVWNIARALFAFLKGRADKDDYGYLRILLNLFLATCATVAVALVLRKILPEKESIDYISGVGGSRQRRAPVPSFPALRSGIPILRRSCLTLIPTTRPRWMKPPGRQARD